MCLSQAELQRFPQLCLMKKMWGGEIDHQGRNNLENICKGFIFFLLIRMIIAPDSFVLPNCSLMHKPLFLLRSSKTPWKDGERERRRLSAQMKVCLGTGFLSLPLQLSPPCPLYLSHSPDFCLFHVPFMAGGCECELSSR